MSFRITALPLAPFAPLFSLSDQELLEHAAVRMTVDRAPGFPCRVSLQDATIGETVILLNYEHQAAASPYRSRHAVFVRQSAREAALDINEIPDVLRTRLLSLRAFDSRGMMKNADVVQGAVVADAIEQMLADSAVDYVHIHYAKPGCYAARAERAT